MNRSSVTELPLLRFIPYRRADIVRMCLDEGRLDAAGVEKFESGRRKIESHFQLEFHHIRQRLKDDYAPLDPDADTRLIEHYRDASASANLATTIGAVLDRANYEKVTERQLKRAFRTASLFQVRLYVDLNDFEEVLLYTRGATQREEEVSQLFGLWRRRVTFTNFDRVALYFRFAEHIDTESTLGGCQPGSTMLKLFQNVPAADLEMLFPNTRIGMRLVDKLLIGVPAVVSGGIVLTTKLGTTLVLLGSLIGFWVGVSSDPVTLDKTALAALAAGIGALVGYLWKQFKNFRNRKLRYTQALTENLYFKLLDNNAGVIYRILDEAEESECKESLIAYYFLLAGGAPLTAAELDRLVEEWFAERWQCRVDFEIDDALGKLDQLSLARNDGGSWVVT